MADNKELLKNYVYMVLHGKITNEELSKRLNLIDVESILNSDDALCIDVYYSLRHHASREEDISEIEWKYFLKCFSGIEAYNLSEKISLTCNIISKMRDCK